MTKRAIHSRLVPGANAEGPAARGRWFNGPFVAVELWLRQARSASAQLHPGFHQHMPIRLPQRLGGFAQRVVLAELVQHARISLLPPAVEKESESQRSRTARSPAAASRSPSRAPDLATGSKAQGLACEDGSIVRQCCRFSSIAAIG